MPRVENDCYIKTNSFNSTFHFRLGESFNSIAMSRSVFYVLLCISSINAQLFFIWSDDDYYATSVTTEYEIYPQDDTDAQAIANDKMSEKIFASILPYREKIRRMTIIREIKKYNGGVEYIDDKYIPNGPAFKDLIYALTKDENIVLGGYSEVLFGTGEPALIIIAMVLAKDILQVQTTYDTCICVN